MKSIIHSAALISAVFVSACSSHIPPEIRQTLDGAPSVVQAHENTDAYLSQKVRWGGVILNIENKHNTSWITILAYPLSENDGEPQIFNESSGRFIAVVDKFLEPLVFAQDRKITIVGNLLRAETVKIGEFPYDYPVIEVKQLYLWSIGPELSGVNHPPYWWHNPRFRPYYPRHYPYYPRHFH